MPNAERENSCCEEPECCQGPNIFHCVQLFLDVGLSM